MSKKRTDFFVEEIEVEKDIECTVQFHYKNGRLKITIKPPETK